MSCGPSLAMAEGFAKVKVAGAQGLTAPLSRPHLHLWQELQLWPGRLVAKGPGRGGPLPGVLMAYSSQPGLHLAPGRLCPERPPKPPWMWDAPGPGTLQGDPGAPVCGFQSEATALTLEIALHFHSVPAQPLMPPPVLAPHIPPPRCALVICVCCYPY